MKPIFTYLVLFIISTCLFNSSYAAEVEKNNFNEDQQLAHIIQENEERYLQSSPFNQPGIGGNNAKLPDLSAATLLAQYQQRLALYQQLIGLDTEKLTQENQINLSVLTYSLKNQLDSYTNKEHYMPLTAESGFHVWIASISTQVDFKTLADYQDYLARLAALPRYFSQQTYWMKEGLNSGISQPKVVLKGFEQSILAYIKEDVTHSGYYKPFTKISTFISKSQQKDLQQQAKKVLNTKVMPAYKAYYDFMVNEYQPNARDNIAASSLPNGKRYYQNRLVHYTTLPMTAEQVHQQGLAEVKRIRVEMDEIIKQVNFDGSFSEFVQFLRTDPQFYASTPTELLKEASFIAKQMDAKLPALFKTLPRTPYGVMAVPENIAPKYTTGRYAGSSRDDQPGNYWVNTYRLDRRPLYVLTALTLHEAVPGHHLQISLAKEMLDVAKFRNRTYISAFGEGWGLYSEYLGIEAGMYEDPYNNFGRLTYEMWRACRLVVDTGMHTQGWSRAQAIDFLASNTALSLHNVTTEIDRYISWPGQALSYKMGELTIKRLRKEAEQALAKDFDLRDFHDQLLKHGSMPLSMMDKVVMQYIHKQTAHNK
ncbi:DUF885 domain-containing protein [Colwellia psychrerythraea]|uniref:DUF885 domain-containing protein n=1 Tax=Colwellia psychrerythraea TaxID=28229 RepID=A0A099KLP2_COLPS|nr:DUF885 domain-containing protein [Colwellia psychrerythraea]KGJ91125.1 protein of unknown function DUF885 [Colwellia psychrerythraea]